MMEGKIWEPADHERPGREAEERQEEREAEGPVSEEKKPACEEDDTSPARERELFLEEQEQFLREKERFYEEMRDRQAQMESQSRRIDEARKSLKKDELFFQQKMEILKSGFAQLADDRKALERDRILLEAKREERRSRSSAEYDNVRLFFSGVSNPLTLKKRHRDLVKIFHPDNLCGDTKLLQQINRMYETMLEEVGWKKKA